MIVIDQYSVSTVPIEMYFDQTRLSSGTAFIWESGGNYFLITNWHNLSGRDTFSGKHLSPTAAEPNNIKVWFNAKGKVGAESSWPTRNSGYKSSALLAMPPAARGENRCSCPPSGSSRRSGYVPNQLDVE